MAFSTVLLIIFVAFLFPFVAACVSDVEHDASKKKIVVLKNMIIESNKEKEDLMRKSKAQNSDLLDMSDELYELKGDMDELQDEFDDLDSSYDDLQASCKSLNIAYEVLEDHNNSIKASIQDLDQKNKDLQALNTSLSQKNSALRDAWSTLSASKFGLENEHTMLESLYKQTCRQNTDLKVNFKYVQEISAANAEQATRSSDALRNAESKIAGLEEQIDHLKDFVDSNDVLTRDAIDENQDLLTRLAALEEENARLVKAASVQERDMVNKDIEISALRCELSFQESALSRAERNNAELLNAHEMELADKDDEVFSIRQSIFLHEEAITRLAKKNAVQEQVHQRLINDAAERGSYIKALDKIILYNHEKREETEKKLAWHRLGFEEERKHAQEEVQGEASAEQSDGQGSLFDGFTEDLPAPAADAPEDAQDLVGTTTVPSEPEVNDASVSEEDLDDVSNVAEDGFTDEEDPEAFSDVAKDTPAIDDASTAETLVLTESEVSTDSDFESIAFSDGEFDVDVLLE